MAASYALIAFQTAYLKCHYPVEFFTALLTVFGGNSDKATNYIQDAKEHGIEVLPPDINSSKEQFSITKENNILYGFSTIKGMVDKGIVEILEKRPFNSLEDLISRTEKRELNKRSIQVLARSGALDSISNKADNRIQILYRLYLYRGDKITDEFMKETESYTKRVMLEDEKNLLGVYVSGHPLEGIARPIDWTEPMENEGRVVGFCLIKEIRQILTKKGEPMAFLTLEFLEREIKATCFPRQFMKLYAFRKGDPEVPVGNLLKEDMIIKIAGTFEEDPRGGNLYSDEETLSIKNLNFFINQIGIPVRANAEKTKEIYELQAKIGSLPEMKPVVEAPRFSMEETIQ